MNNRSIKERIDLRKKLNERLAESIQNNTLKEELENKDSPSNIMRYELQQFDTENPKGTPEEYKGYNYEQWRMEMNSAKRASRIAQEEADRRRIFSSPRTTKRPLRTVDGQEDEFLYDFLLTRKSNKDEDALGSRVREFLQRS